MPDVSMQRLFSGYPDGWPGMSILFLRLGAGVLLIYESFGGVFMPARSIFPIAELAAACAGIFLLAGLWTPVSGVVAAMLELWVAFSRADDLRTAILLATLGASLAMLGPGAWSVDARLFGRKRINIPHH